KRVEVGNEPDLADRPHPRDGLELVERVHRLHRDGEPDPALEPALEARAGRRLAADGSVVAAPEKTDEAEIRLVHSFRELFRRHAVVIVGAGSSRRCRYSLIE